MKQLLRIGSFAMVALALLPFNIPHVHAASATMDIPDRYTEVDPGDRFYYDLSVLYPENTTRKDLTITYRIQEGLTTISTGQYLRAIETQASFSDYIVIPQTAHTGLHTIEIEVSDGDTHLATVSGSFQVASEVNWVAIYFCVLLGAVLLVGIVLFVEILVVTRTSRGR